jgi:hypothetical protein
MRANTKEEKNSAPKIGKGASFLRENASQVVFVNY